MYKGKNKKQGEEEPRVSRAPLPKQGEIMGIIESRLGGNKMMVDCLDNKKRNCRVPGRLRRRLWLRPNDVVIVQPWELDDTRGDILLKYKPNQIVWLKNKGFLKIAKSEF